MKQKYFIGVDISKEKIDVAIIGQDYAVFKEECIKNTEERISKFLNAVLRKFKVNADEILVCCEETGIYGRPLQRVCTSSGLPLWVEPALRIKRASTDMRGKSDKKDALRIAEYSLRYLDKIRLYHEPEKDNRSLQTLLNARESLIDQKTQLNQQLNESKTHDKEKYLLLNSCYKTILASLKKQLLAIEKAIKELIEKNQEMNENLTLLQSIPGIGMQNALQFIVYTRNFKAFETVNHLACYAGVAPFPNESGTIIKKARVSGFANKKLKKLLHLAAMAATRKKGELKDYFIRKVKEGKSKMLVLNNIRNKLLGRMFAVVKRRACK